MKRSSKTRKQKPNALYNKKDQSLKRSIIGNTNQIQQHRKHHNQLNIKQNFKKHLQVLQKVLITLTLTSITYKSNNTNAEIKSQILYNKLKTLNPNKPLASRGKSPSRSTSKRRKKKKKKKERKI